MPNETKTITYMVAGIEMPSFETATNLYNFLKQDRPRKLKIAKITTTTTTTVEETDVTPGAPETQETVKTARPERLATRRSRCSWDNYGSPHGGEGEEKKVDRRV